MIGEDIPDLALLYKQFWNEDSCVELMKKKFRELQKNPSYVFLSAIDGNHLMGSVFGIICEELYGECKPFLVLEDLVVDGRYRRKGVGRALMTEMEKIAVEHGCYQMLFITENDRTDTIAFYASLGFNPDTHKGFKKPLKNKMRDEGYGNLNP